MARVDQWLWAVRIFKTRSMATDACRSGRVRVNGKIAKPATLVRAGDRIEARAERRDWVLDVVQDINKRVGAPAAAECLIDHSPPPAARDESAPMFRRQPGTGRPTKRDRRRMDRLRGR